MNSIPACLILAAAFLAGCGGDGATVAGAEDVAGESGLAPQVMRDMLDEIQECSLASFKRQGHGGRDSLRLLIGKVSVEEVQADARKYAADKLEFYERINPGRTEYARLENAINAIGDAAFVTADGEAAQLQAMALSAYYESFVTGDVCPVDERILRLVRK